MRIDGVVFLRKHQKKKALLGISTERAFLFFILSAAACKETKPLIVSSTTGMPYKAQEAEQTQG